MEINRPWATSSAVDCIGSIYEKREYLERNPLWHVQESPWKAEQIMRMLRRQQMAPASVCEVGCGTGEVLWQLQYHMGRDCSFVGYEVSPQAYALCQERANETDRNNHHDAGLSKLARGLSRRRAL